MEDTRCCGTGTCIINAEGFCWCGQRWDGTRMCFPQAAEGERDARESGASVEPLEQVPNASPRQA